MTYSKELHERLMNRINHKINNEFIGIDGQDVADLLDEIARLTAALTTAQEENKRYKDALEFYAWQSYNWFPNGPSPLNCDNGKTAQSALNGGKG